MANCVIKHTAYSYKAGWVGVNYTASQVSTDYYRDLITECRIAHYCLIISHNRNGGTYIRNKTQVNAHHPHSHPAILLTVHIQLGLLVICMCYVYVRMDMYMYLLTYISSYLYICMSVCLSVYLSVIYLFACM